MENGAAMAKAVRHEAQIARLRQAGAVAQSEGNGTDCACMFWRKAEPGPTEATENLRKGEDRIAAAPRQLVCADRYCKRRREMAWQGWIGERPAPFDMIADIGAHVW